MLFSKVYIFFFGLIHNFYEVIRKCFIPVFQRMFPCLCTSFCDLNSYFTPHETDQCVSIDGMTIVGHISHIYMYIYIYIYIYIPLYITHYYF